ncbi:hypothetical protein [Haloquadratum walsbyi]|jgi:hypothetical protein|uniref:hypothetical protein n=1 Tax=Haloquadratum walsbyi TaxID=293091 RepID=UPI0015F357D5|nr:hypothetical protein [Haloquadratum walsbyi]
MTIRTTFNSIGMLLVLVNSAIGGGAGVMVGTPGPMITEPGVSHIDHSPTLGQTSSISSDEAHIEQLAVTVDGKHVDSGGTITTADDPQLVFNITSQSQLSLISLRIDGGVYRSYTPNTTSYSQSLTLELQPGSHQVVLVTKTPTDVSEYDLRIIEDSFPPTMEFSKPISVSGASLENSYEIDRSRIRIAGTVHDRSDVTKITIKHTYRYTHAEERKSGHSETIIRNPNESISWPVHLIPPQQTSTATNRITIMLYDKFDQIRQYEFRLDVSDEAQPEINITDVEVLYPISEVRVEFSVKDVVGIRSVRTTRTEDSDQGRNLLLALNPTKQPITAEFTHRFELSENASPATIVAEDASGQEEVVTREFNYSALLSPEIRINSQQTQFDTERQLRAVGTISDGKIERVRVETVAANGTVLDIQTVHDDTVVSRVMMDETLRTGTDVYPIRVRVRALDATGTEHINSTTLSQPAIQTQAETASPQSPTEQRTDQTPRQNSSRTTTGTQSVFEEISELLTPSFNSDTDSVSNSSPVGLALLIGTVVVCLFLIIRL